MVGGAFAQSNLSAANQQEPWGNIYSQSKLPACQGEPSLWTNCYGISKYGYAGEYKDGLRHGNGTYTSAFGLKETYIGQFMNGKYHGFGTLYDVNRNIVNSGIWVDGNFSQSVYVQQIPKKNYSVEIENQLRFPQEQQQPQTTTQTVSLPSIGRRVALVVGNANYKVRPLKNPRNDADDISSSLRSSGFEVIDLRDASLQQMRNGVRQFGDRLINNDVGLVYYSGHGVEVTPVHTQRFSEC